MQLSEFIKEHGITFVYALNSDSSTFDAWYARYRKAKKADSEIFSDSINASVTLSRGDKQYTFEYHWGYGIVLPGFLRVKTLADEEYLQALYQLRVNGRHTPCIGRWERTAFKDIQKWTPDLCRIMDSILSDCQGYDNTKNFEDWASEFGYDTDSRKAESVYRVVAEQYKAIYNLLGRTVFYQFLKCETE